MIQEKTHRPAGSTKAPALGLMLAALIAASMMFASPAHAKTFTVNSVGDQADVRLSDGDCDTDGDAFNGSQCTLRAAIGQANATVGADDIHFDISGGGEVKNILPTSELPRITETVTIDGYSQPGATKNTLSAPGKTNAKPLIILGGAFVEGDIFPKDGLDIGAGDVVVRGLVINRFTGDGIDVSGSFEGVRIEGNFIGTDATGTEDFGNGRTGVEVFNTDGSHTIGGSSPASRNLISGNDNAGIFITFGIQNNTVAGNLIGTDKDGGDLGNTHFGVAVSSSGGNTIGGANSAANTIAFNGTGVGVTGTRGGNRILRNSIFANDEQGIALGFFDGSTPNDPGDSDTGPNNLQNFPVLSSATSARSTTIIGTLDSTTLDNFAVQFFSNPSGDAEGKTFLGEKTVTTGSGGNVSFSFTTPTAVPGGSVITATATSAEGDTSEFSESIAVASDRAPAITPLSPRPNSKTRDTTPLIKAKVTDGPADLEKADITLSVDGGRKSFSYDPASGVAVHLSKKLKPGRHTVKVVATDAAGNVASRQWSFTVRK